MNFQLNRWLAYGGESWLADVRTELANLDGFDAWRDNFVVLGERAESDGRTLDATLHQRMAEFFMVPDEPAQDADAASVDGHAPRSVRGNAA